jgi:hypothetical protein
VQRLYDTARYTFSLQTDDLRVGPLEIPIMHDPNYAWHLLQFPASGPGTYRQDQTSFLMQFQPQMDADGH